VKLAEISETSSHTEAGFWCGNPRVIDHFKESGVDGRIILKCLFMKWDVGVWTEWIWFRIGTGGRQLRMR